MNPVTGPGGLSHFLGRAKWDRPPGLSRIFDALIDECMAIHARKEELCLRAMYWIVI